MTLKELEHEAEWLISKDHFESIERWYYDTLDNKWSYVVFITNRSYLLATIFERLTNKKMSGTFYSDSSILLQCKEMAKFYRQEGYFQPILVCDDILIHGRNINHLLLQMEKELVNNLPEEDEYKVKAALEAAVTIHICIEADGILLINSDYRDKVKFYRKEEAHSWRTLSSVISSLIIRTETANTSYIYSGYLTEEEFQKVDLSDYEKTVYHGTKEWTKIHFVGDGNDKKAIFTLRIIKGYGCTHYRVMPFVLLPNLTEGITDCLQEEILKKTRKPEYRDWFKELKSIWGMRNYNELMTMIFSNVILQGFFKKNGLEDNKKNKDEQVIKLARNYNLYGFGTTESILDELLQMQIFTICEMEEIFNNCIPDGFKVITLHDVPDTEKNIKLELNKYYYGKAHEDEKHVIEISKAKSFKDTESQKRKVRGCCFELSDLASEYNKNDVKTMLAYFLQMADADVIEISSYASDNSRVSGFAQYVRPGRIAIYLLALDNYLYVPLLSEMSYDCKIGGKSLEEEIKKYCKKNECDAEGIMIEMIDKMAEIGETPITWKGIYLMRIDAETDEPNWKMKFINEQSALVGMYKR